MTFISKPETNKELILPRCVEILHTISHNHLRIRFPRIRCHMASVGSGTLVIDWTTCPSSFRRYTLEIHDDIIEYMGWAGSSAEEICARSAMVFTVSIARHPPTVPDMPQVQVPLRGWKDKQIDSPHTNRLVPIVPHLRDVQVPPCGRSFTCEAGDLPAGLLPVPDTAHSSMVLRRTVRIEEAGSQKSTEKFEEVYMRKLQEEYTRDDVQEDEWKT